MATELLSKIVDELDARLGELRPLLEEYENLLDAAAALEGAGDRKSAASGDAGERTSAATPIASSRRKTRAPSKKPGTRRPTAGAAPRPEPDQAVPTPLPPASLDRGEAVEPRTAALGESASSESVEQPVEPVESAPESAEKPAEHAAKAAGAAPKRAQRGVASVAILAALEHGSHSVSELTVVSAMGTSIVNDNVRRLLQAGAITRTKREGDGKAAYALVSVAA